jgi:hypothetical protein
MVATYILRGSETGYENGEINTDCCETVAIPQLNY